MKWLKKTAVVSCAVGVLASFAAIQTAKILTEEQKQLALQILNTKKTLRSFAEGLFNPNQIVIKNNLLFSLSVHYLFHVFAILMENN